jgi:hypothetical protein
VVIKAADIELLPIRERDNFCRLINPEAKILDGSELSATCRDYGDAQRPTAWLGM